MCLNYINFLILFNPLLILTFNNYGVIVDEFQRFNMFVNFFKRENQ